MHRLFFFEAYVDKLFLNEYSSRDCEGSLLSVKIHFLAFPPLEINECDREITEEERRFEFEAGATVHFSMTPQLLEKRLKRQKLMIGAYKRGESFPFCQVFTSLSGCICDLVSDSTGPTTSPFQFRGPFALVDAGGHPAGEVEVDLSLCSLGRFRVTHFGLVPGKLLTKNHPEGEEYAIRESDLPLLDIACRACLPHMKRKRELSQRENGVSKRENLMLEVVGISPGADVLALGKPPEREKREPLFDPSLLEAKKGKRGGKKKGRKR